MFLKGWVKVSLRELVGDGIFTDGDWVESKDQNPSGTVRLIQLADVGVGRFIDKSSRFLTEKKAVELGCTFLEPGDVLISRMADPIGRACIFPGVSQRSVTVVDVCIVRPGTSRVDARWLTAAINSPQFRRAVGLAGSGTTRSRVSRSNLGALELPIPPINEQRRIVAKLEALQARSRRARDALDAVPPLLEKLRQSILAAAFRGDLTKDWRAKHKDVEPASELLKCIRAERRKKWEEAELAKMKAKGKAPTDDAWKARYQEPVGVDAMDLPELPAGWAWARSNEVIEPGTVISYGIVLPGPPLKSGIPYVRGQDIENGRLLTGQLLHTSSAIAAAHSRSELREGDVLLCIIRHLKVAIVPSGLDGANITQGTVRLRPSFAITAPYLAAYLVGEFAQQWMKRRYFGLAMPRINVEDAREIPIPLAPFAEQAELVRRLESKLGNILRLHGLLRNTSSSANLLEKALLAKAFRGQLVLQDPNDESAEVMLARVRVPDGGAITEAAGPSSNRRRGRSRTKAGVQA
jgi:type I restriction enzyme S subunit